MLLSPHPAPVCIRETDRVRALQEDHGLAIWVAELADGLFVYQDSDQAWANLRGFVHQGGSPVVGLHLKFRNEWRRDVCPRYASGYFFSKGMAAILGQTRAAALYRVGHLDCSAKLSVQTWNVPELSWAGTEERNVNWDDPRLILSEHRGS